MTSMPQLPAFKFCSPSAPASSWRRAAASEMPARTRLRLKVFGKIPAQLSRSAFSPKAEASDPGAGARKRRRHALTAMLKSP
jgi:hypothetical protein